MRLARSVAMATSVCLVSISSLLPAPVFAASIDDKTAQKQAEIPTCTHKLGALAVHEPQNNWWGRWAWNCPKRCSRSL